MPIANPITSSVILEVPLYCAASQKPEPGVRRLVSGRKDDGTPYQTYGFWSDGQSWDASILPNPPDSWWISDEMCFLPEGWWEMPIGFDAENGITPLENVLYFAAPFPTPSE